MGTGSKSSAAAKKAPIAPAVSADLVMPGATPGPDVAVPPPASVPPSGGQAWPAPGAAADPARSAASAPPQPQPEPEPAPEPDLLAPLRPFDKNSDSHDRVKEMLDSDAVPGAGWDRASKYKALVAGRIAASCPASAADLIGAAYAGHGEAAKMTDAAEHPENYRYVKGYDGSIGVWRSDASYIPAGAEPLTPAALKEHAASKLVQKWAGSSNDHDAVALALQEAAITEFGLKGTAPWQMDGGLRAEVDNVLAGNGSAYRAFLRTQYELTQEDFKNRGITSMNVIRGMKWMSAHVPEWAKNARTGKVVPAPPLRPMSSWTVNPTTATSFAKGGYYRVTIAADLPVEHVLSWPRSGFGCLGEYEVVALAGPGEVRIRSAAQPKLPAAGAPHQPP